MQAGLGMTRLWLVAVGLSVLSTTSRAGNGTQVRLRNRNDGGAVVAQLVQQLFAMNNKIHALESSQQATRRELQAAKAELNSSRTDTRSQLSSLSAMIPAAGQGSTFIRWGRKGCPNNTILVYSGIAGGKYYSHTGGGTNPLCLTRSPEFDSTSKPSYHGYLYGGEYENIQGHHDHDVPCALCLAPQSTTIMVPARLTCPAEWTPQYSGHLASERSIHQGGEYVCLDGSLEDASSGVRNDEGLLFYYVTTVCGSLPCPPYINDRVVTCVVCSK